MHGVEISGFTSGYPNYPVIDKLTLPCLPRGKITALLGANGCGKSTLLRALAGLNRAKGALLLDGEDLQARPFKERASQVVYLPQSLPPGVHLHVLESIIVAGQAGISGGESVSKSQVMALLTQLGIGHLALRYLDNLSGGQKQLVGLAQSLIRQPSLLLLDEPLSALDLNYQFHVMNIIAQQTLKRNIVTIVVVHDINIALRHSDRVVMLKAGRLVAAGKPGEVITPENLAAVYGVKGRVECCSKGIPQVIIDGLIQPPEE